MTLRVGCCGFAEAQNDYFRHFPAVEIQKTFYQPPRKETAQKWRQAAPADFVFTLKAWQLITHEPTSPTYRRLSTPIPREKFESYGSFRPTEEVFAAWGATRELAEILRAPVVVFQCPARFDPAPEHLANLRDFFSAIDRGSLLLAWEPRGDWPPEKVRELCRDFDLIHCVDPFGTGSVTGGPVYFRLHGIGGYRYRFSDDDLRRLKEVCGGREGFVLFNNLTMKRDALKFRKLLQEG